MSEYVGVKGRPYLLEPAPFLSASEAILQFLKHMRASGSWDAKTLNRAIEVAETIIAQDRKESTSDLATRNPAVPARQNLRSAMVELAVTDLFGTPMERSAKFNGPGQRLTLSRTWDGRPRALVIGCNSSTADALKDDPTSRWWNRWFWNASFGGYDAANLYPFCTSSPAECRRIVESIEGGAWDIRDDLYFVNLPHVVKLAKAAHQVFVCWGAIAWDDMWIEHVVEEIQSGVAPYPDLWCWGKTASGAPKHPLARGKHRISADQEPILWRAGHVSTEPKE